MEDHHKEAIRSNLALLCRDVDYARLRPEMLKHRLFPERQLRLLEERAGAGAARASSWRCSCRSSAAGPLPSGGYR